MTGDVVPDFDTLITVIGTRFVEEPDVIVSNAVVVADAVIEGLEVRDVDEIEADLQVSRLAVAQQSTLSHHLSNQS